MAPARPSARDAAQWLAAALDGFVHNALRGVARMMACRNALVRPLGLRTSALGCPVSSLLAASSPAQFDARFPVHAQDVAADDKHLVFRSCVGVRLLDDGAVEFSLSDRVACTTLFGRLYMASIARTHRGVIARAMLAHAVQAAMRHGERDQAPTMRASSHAGKPT